MAANTITGMAVGSFGVLIVLTAKFEGAVQDLSSYTGVKTVHARSPDGRKTAVATASFVSDGSNGQVSFSWASGDIDRPGLWECTLELLKTGAQLVSDPFYMDITKRAGT